MNVYNDSVLLMPSTKITVDKLHAYLTGQ